MGYRIYFKASLLLFSWMRITLLILVAYAAMAFADTTWVAGTVSGVWGREGNPYLVTDTLTIPHDSTLNILPGVQIYFQNQQIRRTPINVLGRLRAIGEEGDSIYFYSPVAGFGGITNQYTPGTEICLDFCVIDSTYFSVFSSHGITVVKHSRLKSYYYPIHGESNVDTVQYCYFQGATSFFAHGSIVYQYNQGIVNSGFSAQLCVMAPIFENQIGGISILEGNDTEIYNNQLNNAFSYYNSSNWHNNRIENLHRIEGGSPIFEHNTVGNITIVESFGVVTENEVYGTVNINSSEMTFQKNLVVSSGDGISITGTYITSGVNVIQGNTIIFDNYGIEILSSRDTTYVLDNILMGDGVNATGVHNGSSYSCAIRYNDFCNVTEATYGCEPDTGNILLDPCFRAGNPYDYQLQANSPCIDAGDPTLPLDPDGTRADMGCYFFDHRIDNPPAIISPVVVNVQRGDTLRYVARATDDYGPLEFGFWDLPPWLQEENHGLDWVADSAAVSGVVPFNQEDFTFGVWVEDGAAQRDSQVVSVLVSPYTILAGEVTGVLDRERSPYMVVEDVVVPAGDSLTIEPGVEIRFQWEPVEDLRHRILVRGKLNAIGTPEDSIYFLPEFGDSLSLAWRGIWCLGQTQDTLSIRYSHFTNGKYAIVADSHSTIIIENTTIIGTYRGIWVTNQSIARIDSCEFQLPSNSDCSVFVDSATSEISNCHSETPLTGGSGAHFIFYSNAHGSVHGSTLIRGSSSYFEYSSEGTLYRNKVIGISNQVGLYNGSSGLVANNIFLDGGGLVLAGAESVLVANGLFYQTGTGVLICAPSNQFVRNSIFIGNDQGISAIETPAPFANISYNDFFNNDSNFVNCILDSTNLYLDPMIQDTINFRLLAGSPCIDAGDPDPFFNDADSTRNDIGCWGGPWGESYPYVPVFSHQTKPIPTEFILFPPYPNPFNSVLVITFALPIQIGTTINIYNILGQKVQEYTFPPLSPGVHRVVWNSGSCASGLYIIQLISGNQELKQKALLIK